eukprot:2619520-Alexandrium_andersonii.AAC.1
MGSMGVGIGGTCVGVSSDGDSSCMGGQKGLPASPFPFAIGERGGAFLGEAPAPPPCPQRSAEERGWAERLLGRRP